jgi:hypothetical protein
VAWFGVRVYVGAWWTVMQAVDGSLTWTEIKATNPFPNPVALALSFRTAAGAPDPRFAAALTLGGLAQTTFLARNLTVPNMTTGWFLLTSSPTPIVPSALVYWSRAPANQVEVINVPIEQLDADGFPIGDAAAQPRPPEPSPPQPIQSLRHPPVTDLWAEGAFGDEHATEALELFRTAQLSPGSLDATEPPTYLEGLLLDDEAHEFRDRFEELPKG